VVATELDKFNVVVATDDERLNVVVAIELDKFNVVVATDELKEPIDEERIPSDAVMEPLIEFILELKLVVVVATDEDKLPILVDTELLKLPIVVVIAPDTLVITS
jgi:hypothetical protein